MGNSLLSSSSSQQSQPCQPGPPSWPQRTCSFLSRLLYRETSKAGAAALPPSRLSGSGLPPAGGQGRGALRPSGAGHHRSPCPGLPSPDPNRTQVMTGASTPSLWLGRCSVAACAAILPPCGGGSTAKDFINSPTEWAYKSRTTFFFNKCVTLLEKNPSFLQSN